MATATPRTPGVFVQVGGWRLPLVYTLGPRCTGCDENGEVVCPRCQGQGWWYDDPADHDWNDSCGECQTTGRVPHEDCAGSRFQLFPGEVTRSECPHQFLVEDEVFMKTRFFCRRLSRCSLCGLGQVEFLRWPFDSEDVLRKKIACAGCGLFICGEK